MFETLIFLMELYFSGVIGSALLGFLYNKFIVNSINDKFYLHQGFEQDLCGEKLKFYLISFSWITFFALTLKIMLISVFLIFKKIKQFSIWYVDTPPA